VVSCERLWWWHKENIDKRKHKLYLVIGQISYPTHDVVYDLPQKRKAWWWFQNHIAITYCKWNYESVTSSSTCLSHTTAHHHMHYAHSYILFLILKSNNCEKKLHYSFFLNFFSHCYYYLIFNLKWNEY
jgi:hypothetical protein